MLGLLAGFVYKVKGWHEDSLKLPVITEQLQAEIACTIPSNCASSAMKKAEESKQAVEAAQSQAKADNDRKEAESKANEQDAAKRNAENLKQLQNKLNDANFKLMQHASPQCKQWLDQVISCDIQ